MAVVVSLAKVLEAFELATDETSSFVNTSTGEVRMVMHDEMRMAKEESADDLPDWQQQAVAAAREILDSDDWIELPDKFDIHEWAIMDRFASEETEPDIRAELQDSLRGAGAFRRFKAAIYQLNLQDEWFKYRARSFEDIARKWLTERHFQIGI